MKFHSVLSTATSTLAVGAAFFAIPAFAQSTGSVDFEEGAIVVTGTVQRDIAGVKIPDTPKAKQVLTQEVIGRQTPGQTVNDVINLVPGVSFQNNDPFGSAGGTLTIRGFDDSRISQTFDGIPLNDTGNYALYTNQQLDPELIEQVNVNLGTTDVDSPTAAASGSTVNYRTRNPSEEFGVRMVGSIGDFDFMRMFGVLDTGVFTPFGTRAFFAASKATNDAVYGGIGKINKSQFNAKIYQPIGSNGDFISLSGHYNRNRNNFFGSVRLINQNYGTATVNGSSSGRFPLTKDERFYEIARCQVPEGIAGVRDTASSCGSDYEFRFNPSNTANIRMASKFTLSDKLTLTVDPYYQYSKANGGGTLTANEYGSTIGGSTYYGCFGSGSTCTPYAGVDLNGDGDTLDTVRLLAPSQTITNRIGVMASLRYDLDEHNRFRIAYSYDRGRHRQTGEMGYLNSNGFGEYFPVDDPILDANGNPLQKRDRLSYAILHQISGEYNGDFMSDSLHVNVGVRAPFFRRNLTNYCTTNTANGVSCSGDAAAMAAYNAANPTFGPGDQRVFNYNKVLPTAGLTFDVVPAVSLFFNYSRGLQVPGTDQLYQTFQYDRDSDLAQPKPETTDNFDLGVRYSSGIIQAQLSGWYTIFQDRIASSYDQDTQLSIFRNLGRVDKYGVDGSFSVRPIKEVSFYVFGSYLKSKIKDDVLGGRCTSATSPVGASGCTAAGDYYYYETAGKRESGAPVYTFGARVQGDVGPVELGVQAKRTGPRYYNDVNLPFQSSAGVVYWGAKIPAYTLVDLDARVKLDFIGLSDQTFLQLNVTNLFDKLYVGGFDGVTSPTSSVYGQIGAPRTFIGSISFGF